MVLVSFAVQFIYVFSVHKKEDDLNKLVLNGKHGT